MKTKPATLAGLVLAGATAATLALLPFIGGEPEPSPVSAPEPAGFPAPAADAPAPEGGGPAVLGAPAGGGAHPMGGGSLGLVRRANAPPQRDPAVCLHPEGAGFVEPPTLAALLACQEAARRGRTLDDAYVEFQRAEVRSYLSRHPERATTEEPAKPARAP